MTTIQRAAELQALLEGVPLPARKRELVDYARREDEHAARELDALPERQYPSLDEVGEELVHVQPRRRPRPPEVPREESGEPPGGDDYTRPFPTAGAVRPDAPPENPPQKALEEQAKAQKQQAERQRRFGLR